MRLARGSRSALATGQVVADDQLAVVAEAAGQLLELEGEQPAVGAELDDVAGDLVADPADHLEALQHAGDVADGDQVLDLERGQGAGDLVEAQLVALEGRQRLVGAGQDGAGVLEDVAPAADVERDDPHRLADRDDREAGLLGHPLGGAVPGAGLAGLDRGVGDQLGGGAQDPGGVAVEHDARRPSWPARAAGSRRTRRRAGSRRCDELSTILSWPSTISAPVRPRRMRSRPSRSSVPGATAARVARSRSSSSLAMRPLLHVRRLGRPPADCRSGGSRQSNRDGAAAQDVRAAPRLPDDVGHLDDPHARRAIGPLPSDARRARRRVREAEPGGLGQPARRCRSPAGSRRPARPRRTRRRRSAAARSLTALATREGDGEVGGRLGEPDPADGGDVDVAVADRRLGAALASTARIIATRAESRPLVARRGVGISLWATSACTSVTAAGGPRG